LRSSEGACDVFFFLEKTLTKNTASGIHLRLRT
jgi:hypothetical protein